MKNILLIFFFLFFVKESNAQVVYHFPHDSASWGQFSGFWGNGVYGNTVFYSAKGDTVIGNFNYIKIIQSDSLGSSSELFALLREDTSGKVWVKFQCQFCDTSENLLYDFDVTLDDTITVIRDPYSTTITHLVVVDSITNILLDNSEIRRCIYLGLGCGGGSFGGDQLIWIEGIGSNAGLFYPPGECLIDGLYWLTCFHQHDTLKYLTGTTCNLILGTNEIENNLSLDIYPNPITENFQLNISGAETNAVISIYNIIGQQQFHSLIHPKNNLIHQTISLNNYSEGIYFVSVTVNRENFIRKIIKQ